MACGIIVPQLNLGMAVKTPSANHSATREFLIAITLDSWIPILFNVLFLIFVLISNVPYLANVSTLQLASVTFGCIPIVL